MKRFFKSLALGILLALPWVGASAQQVNNYCWVDAGPPVHWAPCNSINPLAVTGTFTPSGNTVVVGPTADGSPASTPPVLIGGTVDGSASGNVGVAKIDAAGLAYHAVVNWGGTALGAMATYGTSPGAVLVPGVNAFITNTVTTSLSGNVTVVGPTADGSPATTPPVLVGGTADGTATGTVDVWKVDAAGLGFVTDSTGAATQAPVAPATATATKSQLIGAQATTSAVNPTTGQQAALSSDTNNNLLVSPGGAPNLATAQVSVTTGNISAASARALRRAITITNVTGTGAVFCGNTGVTTSTGIYLGATAGSSITLNTTAAVFCTVASTTQTVTVAETY